MVHYMMVGIVLGQFDWLLLLQLHNVVNFAVLHAS